VILDCLGKRCPLPIIELAAELKNLPIGSEVTLLSDDPASAPDLIAWARMTGNSVVQTDSSTYTIAKLAN
jgi:tRNA 2-thiouridine synthesizing protein A